MTDVFVICNQQGHFWGKSKTWVDGSEPKTVMRVKNRDEASNTLFELSSKDFELRGDIREAEVNAKGDPIVEVSDIPLPTLPEDEEEVAAEAAIDEPVEEPSQETPENSDIEVQ